MIYYIKKSAIFLCLIFSLENTDIYPSNIMKARDQWAIYSIAKKRVPAISAPYLPTAPLGDALN